MLQFIFQMDVWLLSGRQFSTQIGRDYIFELLELISFQIVNAAAPGVT